MKARFATRAELAAAVTESLRNDSLKDFRRDLDKALESADRLMTGHFMGRYWADRAIADLVALGCGLASERIQDNPPHYQIVWKGTHP